MDLARIFQQINSEHFADKLPMPELVWNSRLRATAGRFTPGNTSSWRPRSAMIEIATYLKDIESGEVHIRDTMLHEMIHYILWFEKKPYGHTAEFRQIMRRTNAKRYNTVPMERPNKYIYQCPACLNRVAAKRKFGNVACVDCCQKLNRGYYSRKYRLEIVEYLDQKQISKAWFHPNSNTEPQEKFEYKKVEQVPTLTPQDKLLDFEQVVSRIKNIRDVIMSAGSRK